MKAWAVGIALFTAAVLGYLFVLPQGSSEGLRTTAGPDRSEVFYWTDPGLEPDPCVAAWLLTRYVTPGARVVIRSQSPDGIPFDVPGCELQRRPGLSTSDMVMRTYGIDDPLAAALADVVRELELKPWTTNDEEFFVRVRSGLAEAINASESDEACLQRAMEFLDSLREERPVLPTREAP